MPDASPVVSVIVPVYNTAQHLAACLDSIVNQSYAELEILLVDDGSTDDSSAVCRRYAEQDPRITLLSQRNSGVSAARNAGLERATGVYVHFVDSDDWIETTLYERVVAAAESASATVAIFEYFVDHPERSVRHRDPRSRYGLLELEDALELTFASPNSFAVTRLLRRSCIGDVTFRRDLHWGEETLFLCEVLEQAANVIHLDEALYHYRQSAGSATRSGFGPRRLSGIATAEALIAMTSERHPALVPQAYEFLGGILTQLLVEIWPDREARREHGREVRSRLVMVLRKLWRSADISWKSKTRWALAAASPSATIALRAVRHGARRSA